MAYGALWIDVHQQGLATAAREGAPKPKGRGNGDIRYRLEIEMPEKLTSEQKEAAEKLLAALGVEDTTLATARFGDGKGGTSVTKLPPLFPKPQ